jgi:DNA-binding transcriptional MerR regulator
MTMLPAQQTYSTREALSALADRGHDTTARVLRNVEKQLGLEIGRSGPAIDEAGQREYTGADLQLLERVLTLQKAGLRLIEIRAILLEQDYDMIHFQAQNLRKALALLEELEAQVEPFVGTLAPLNGYRDRVMELGADYGG